MACPITDNDQRKYPLKQPDGWKPKVPRWTLTLPDDVKELVVAYIGVQDHSSHEPKDTNGHAEEAHSEAFHQAVKAVDDWTNRSTVKPTIVNRFQILSGRDISGSREWACYWSSKLQADASLAHLDLKTIHSHITPDSARRSIGLWLEVITPDLTRFETNYSGDDYRPGLAELPGTTLTPHTLTGYWGAARDRIRASAHDDFQDPSPPVSHNNNNDNTEPPRSTKTLRLHGTNTRTIAHIRSGQFWANCANAERDAYEHDIEPHLLAGLADIHQRPHDLGDHGLRFLRNLGGSRETCAAGFSRSLADLEGWAKDCPSHHRIYGSAVRHKLRYGGEAKMRTWHEVAVLKPGEARWEYLGCDPGTGTIEFQTSEVGPLYS